MKTCNMIKLMLYTAIYITFMHLKSISTHLPASTEPISIVQKYWSLKFGNPGVAYSLPHSSMSSQSSASNCTLQTEKIVNSIHSRFSQNPSQAKNQKNSSNKSKAIFQYLCMSKVYAEILRIGFPSCFRDFGP